MIERKFTSQAQALDYQKSLIAQGFKVEILAIRQNDGNFNFIVKGERRLI